MIFKINYFNTIILLQQLAMWPQIVFRIVLLTFICIGLSFSKRHNKKYRWKDNYRGSPSASLENNHNDLQSKDIYSITNRKPLIFGIKKALDPESLSKWLANLSFNQKEHEFPVSSKSDSEKNFIHISQTEYPQIFHTQKRNAYGSKNISDNYIFYPFKNVKITSLDLLHPELINIKLQDTSVKRENVEENELKTSPIKKIKPVNFNQIQVRKISKYNKSYGKQIKQESNNDSIASITDSPDAESENLTQLFFNRNRIKNLRNEMFKKSSIGFNKDQVFTIPKTLKYCESFINGESSTACHAGNNITDVPNSVNPADSPSVVTSTSGSGLIIQEQNKKWVPYITGPLDARHSLNLQITLTLTVNNDSYSLIPTQ